MTARDFVNFWFMCRVDWKKVRTFPQFSRSIQQATPESLELVREGLAKYKRMSIVNRVRLTRQAWKEAKFYSHIDWNENIGSW